MNDYTIRLQLNPKPGPRSRVDWDCWIEGDEEAGCEHGSTAWDALRYMADCLEMDAHKPKRPECPACNSEHCVCSYLRADRGIIYWAELQLDSMRIHIRYRCLQDDSTESALEILACESLLETGNA